MLNQLLKATISWMFCWSQLKHAGQSYNTRHLWSSRHLRLCERPAKPQRMIDKTGRRVYFRGLLSISVFHPSAGCSHIPYSPSLILPFSCAFSPLKSLFVNDSAPPPSHFPPAAVLENVHMIAQTSNDLTVGSAVLPSSPPPSLPKVKRG